VVVNTSVYEGMPNTFMQAWARGVPSVATVDVGAPVHKVFGDADAGAAEIERLFIDDAHYRKASNACLEYFSRVHSSDAVLKQYAAVFEGLYQ
jgi:glycosyltransferase involved in cell wall biosynthesis